MVTIRKPKMRKYPKKPRTTASVEVKQNFLNKCKEIDKDNNAKMAEYKRKIAKKAADKKKSASLDKQIGSLGRSSKK